MKKNLFILLVLIEFNLNAQSFKQGDIIINGNYGGPQITPAIIRLGLNTFYKLNKSENENFSFAISNSGVLNAKTEYGFTEDIGLGLAASYWNMKINVKNNYNAIDPTDNVTKAFVDDYELKIAALALGLRGNYHFIGEGTNKKIDPYGGFTLGLTKYTSDISFQSNFPDKKLPINTYQYKTGWGFYFSTTFGIRYYPVKFLGLNAEIGWDRGAFLFGGVAFKFGTKPPKFLSEN